MNWCRDIDYGNLPQWLALIVGGVVAGYTIMGIRTARRSYRDDVRTREYAQARLVYAEIVRDQFLFPEEKIAFSVKDAFGHRLIEDMSAVQDDWHYDVEDYGSTLVIKTGVESYPRATLLRVRNLSDELVSRVRVHLETSDGVLHGFHEMDEPSLLRPGSDLHFVLITASRDASVEARVSFRDSSGQWWVREGAEPVRKAGERAGPWT